MRKLSLAAVVLLCFVLPAHTFGQSSNATLGGSVSDASGALIPGVTITATNTQTGIVTTVLSNETGSYQFAALQTGTYKVSAELPGFQIQTYNDVILGVAQRVRLNFTLQVGSVATAVEVNVAADTLLATSSSSVGAVLPEYKLRDLPLSTRNVLDLIATTAGTQGSNFAGARITQVNTTRDGVSVSDGRYDVGAFSATYVSPDLVEEVRIIVAPADVEMGRGSGQVQMVTRSGTNQFRGSLFWTNRNSVLNANSWLNNFNGVGKDYKNGNQFGGRLGGPIVRNKTFFFFLYEGQRYINRQNFTGAVLTAEARRGIFRYFPGVQNANAFANNPTVDALGNPVKPRGATGDLQSFSVFGRDPFRPGFDPSGWVQRAIARMPLPNDFTVGDGLNTVGHRWVRRVVGLDDTQGGSQSTNRNQYNVRFDHNFNASHKVTFSGSLENNWSMTDQAGPSNWPNGYSGNQVRKAAVYSASLVSTLSSAIVNEARWGKRRTQTFQFASFDKPDEDGAEALSTLPTSNGIPFLPRPVLFPDNYISYIGSTRGQKSPLFSYADTLSWTRGKHAFKGGFEARFTSSDGWSSGNIAPNANFGAGGIPVTGITSVIPGLTGNSVATAENLLIDLSGSLSTVIQAFQIRRPTDLFKDYRELREKRRDFHQNEWGAFFKDDWKIRPDLTLNLGVRYDYYGVPWESEGIAASPVGGSAGLFGLSGTGFADLWQPGRLNGSLTTVEFVGKNSPHPDKQLYKDDWNNFAPGVGLSWSLPWWGKDKTVLRAGYGINYQGAARFLAIDSGIGGMPGLVNEWGLTSADYLDLARVTLPLPGGGVPPLQVSPVTRRTETIQAFNSNRVNPYIQNWNLELQRELVRNLTLEVRYVGSKGTKLWGGIPINDVNIFENGILEAFNITRAGGNAPLFDRMLRGLNLGLGQVNGMTVTGSASLRANTLTRSFIADGDVGQLADFLNTSTTVTNEGGGLLRNGGLPENFIVVNPQFRLVIMDSNPGNSTYHSMNLQVTKRLSHGFTNQTAYTWSRTLGEASTDGTATYLNPRNRALNKSLTTFHRTHDIRSNGTFELPFGPNRRFLSGGPGFLTRLLERWQLGAIFSWTSGAPLTITASTSSFTQSTNNTPNILGPFPKGIGKVTPVANGATYFAGFQQVTEPGIDSVTTSEGLRSRLSNRAITDAQGNLILVNPVPGQLGSLGERWIEGPSRLGLHVNLVKRVRIDERKEFEVRVDAINVLNTPQWQNPTTDINSLNFGRITGADGARTFTINARVNF